jgi:hypothetical protein
MSCGRQLKSLQKARFIVSNLPWFDTEIENAWLAESNKAFQEARKNEDAAQAMREGEWWERYNLYLESEHWQRVRNIVLRRDTICQVCFEVVARQVHHLTYQSYNNVGMSFSVECVGVCNQCHDKLHGKGALCGFE